MNKYRFWILSSALIILSSCDPTNPIIISNSTNEPVIILAKTNSHFHTEKENTGVTPDGFEIYQLNAKESMQVGIAIAEIDDEIPFESIRIVKNKDTVSAFNQVTIKELFDKNILGKPKKPYHVSIK